MKIKKSTKNPRLFVKLLLAALLISGVYFGYAYASKNWPFSKNSPPTAEQREQANRSDTLNSQTKQSISGESRSINVDTQKTIDEIPVSTTLSVSIDSLAQSQDGTVSYRASATGSSNGTCSATFTHDLGKPVIRNTETTSGICDESIPALEFDAIGTWTLTLRYYANDTQTTATKTIEIK